MTGPLIVGVLVAGGLWLLLQPGRIRTVLAFVLLSHAANVTVLLASSGSGSAIPFADQAGDAVDPLPQAFVLTAIVISFGTTAFLLSLAGGHREEAPGHEPATSEDDTAPGVQRPSTPHAPADAAEVHDPEGEW